MSIDVYYFSRQLDAKLQDIPFDALLMHCMRRADSDNYAALDSAFPAIGAELRERYYAPAGLLRSDLLTIDQAGEVEESVKAVIDQLFE